MDIRLCLQLCFDPALVKPDVHPEHLNQRFVSKIVLVWINEANYFNVGYLAWDLKLDMLHAMTACCCCVLLSKRLILVNNRNTRVSSFLVQMFKRDTQNKNEISGSY